MASVVTGLAVYGFSPLSGSFGIIGSAAHAQVNRAVSAVAQPYGFADMVEQVKPSVISVKVTMKEKASDTSEKSDEDGSGSPMERFFRQFGGPDGMPHNPGRGGRHGEMGQGSGFFISSDGYAVTNNHVVDGADKVEVTTDAGKTYTAKVIGTDPRTDVALIKVEGNSDFPFAKLSESKARIGDWSIRRFHSDRCARQQGQFGWSCLQYAGRGRWREHCDLFAVRRQCRNRIFYPGPNGKECHRPAQGQGKRQPRLDRRSDSAGNAGHRR